MTFTSADDIQAYIIAQLANVNITVSTAKFSIRRLTTRAFAECAWLFYTMFNVTHKAEIQSMLDEQIPGRLTWYQEMLLKFQYGSQLVTDKDYYDNSDLTDDEVAAQQILTQGSATVESGYIVLKALKGSNPLVKLSDAELAALTSYVDEWIYADDKIEVRSVEPDKITLKATIKYDPQILLSTGARIDGLSATPIQNAIKAFLLQTQFNGEYIKQKHVDYVQAVTGVNDIVFDQVLVSRYAATAMQSVYMDYQPYSGALQFYDDADIQLTFIAGT